jgi:hypothetical protein
METEPKLLTNAEVIAELKSRTKPYIGIESAAMFSQMCTRIIHGIAKPVTVVKFFGKYGYAGTYDKFYIKSEDAKE